MIMFSTMKIANNASKTKEIYLPSTAGLGILDLCGGKGGWVVEIEFNVIARIQRRSGPSTSYGQSSRRRMVHY